MAQIITPDGMQLEYLEGRVLLNGLPTTDWEAIYIKNGDQNQFYGFHNRKTDISYDIKGVKLNLTNEDLITL